MKSKPTCWYESKQDYDDITLDRFQGVLGMLTGRLYNDIPSVIIESMNKPHRDHWNRGYNGCYFCSISNVYHDLILLGDYPIPQ
jgi:hypothetical protein